LRMMAARKGKTISAMMLGKIKTTVQMITVISMMLNLMLGLEWLGMINDVLLYVVVALTMISGAVYLYRGRQYVL
ncbi:CDP-diacylglycerol--glycerol-3-phosphate 3-phosphatidyltransferase, partial [Candidatus Saccharibacteria bacterium]|nr:CDP-diacylglycerol--glycerol-3-phosphate 3-phosphatidyltransferase [Candidatus Saccharibacteria bacterium]